jgi:hypothetical protein
MSLEKVVVVDQIEVTSDGVVQVRLATKIIEDGSVISVAYHRNTVAPGQDFSGEDAKVKAICLAAHTDEVIAAYASKIQAIETKGV